MTAERLREGAGDMTVTARGGTGDWQHPHPKILCPPRLVKPAGLTASFKPLIDFYTLIKLKPPRELGGVEGPIEGLSVSLWSSPRSWQLSPGVWGHCGEWHWKRSHPQGGILGGEGGTLTPWTP